MNNIKEFQIENNSQFISFNAETLRFSKSENHEIYLRKIIYCYLIDNKLNDHNSFKEQFKLGELDSNIKQNFNNFEII